MRDFVGFFVCRLYDFFVLSPEIQVKKNMSTKKKYGEKKYYTDFNGKV